MTKSSEIASLLLAHTWQIALLILFVLLCVRLLARSRPHLAHALWLVVLLKCLTPPLWSSPAGVFCWLQAAPRFEQQLNSEAPPDDKPAENSAQSSSPSTTTRNDWRLVEPRLSAVIYSNVQSSLDSGRLWSQALLYVWMAGTCCFLASIIAQLMLLIVELRRSGAYRDPDLDDVATRLAKRIGVRRRVRVLVTRGRIGPAVIGLVRPTILLPAVIVNSRTTSELEPILAHELIHVRRGDLWLGFLQLLASSLWWFHPLVRLAMQRAMAEAERCCDEAVIALLRCDPASYARCLIDVLAKKQELMAAPAFPGVRPLDVTVTRLERIMKLGHGCRTRTPWWCWVVMGTAALVTLPGAAFVLKAQEQPQPSAVPIPAERTRAVGSPTPIREYEPELTYVVVYQIDDIVEKVKNDLGCEEQICREIILKKLRNENGIVRSSPAIHRQLEADGNRVVVQDTTIGHKRLNEVVEGLRKYGFRQVMFQIWLFQGPSEEFARIHSALSEADQSHNQVRLLQVEPSAIAKKIEANAALKTISRPQVVVEDSEQAQLSIGVENGEEVSLALQPFVKGEKEIQLVVTLGNSNVSENELVIPATVNSPEQKIKPRYRRELQADIRMNTNEVLAIESAPVPTGDGNEAILAVVKAHILTGEDLSESKLGLKLETAPDGASSEGKIPYLGDIPYVGRLFKR